MLPNTAASFLLMVSIAAAGTTAATADPVDAPAGAFDTTAAVPGRTLYVRLGGRDGVQSIADSLIDRAASSPTLGRSFKDADLKRIKRLLAEQLCELSGGPCRYSGDSMRLVHAGHHISQAEFYSMVDLLRQILRERRIDLASRNRLLRLLAPMKRDVVEHRAAQPAGLPPTARSSP